MLMSKSRSMSADYFSIADLFQISFNVKLNNSDSSSAIGHALNKNTVLISYGQHGLSDYQLILVGEENSESPCIATGSVFPLHTYTEDATRTLNLNKEVIKSIANNLSLTFVQEKEGEGNVCFMNSEHLRPEFKVTFSAIDLLDYSYATLHNLASEASNKHIGADTKIPYPRDPNTFWDLVNLGSQLRKQHLFKLW